MWSWRRSRNMSLAAAFVSVQLANCRHFQSPAPTCGLNCHLTLSLHRHCRSRQRLKTFLFRGLYSVSRAHHVHDVTTHASKRCPKSSHKLWLCHSCCPHDDDKSVIGVQPRTAQTSQTRPDPATHPESANQRLQS